MSRFNCCIRRLLFFNTPKINSQALFCSSVCHLHICCDESIKLICTIGHDLSHSIPCHLAWGKFDIFAVDYSSCSLLFVGYHVNLSDCVWSWAVCVDTVYNSILCVVCSSSLPKWKPKPNHTVLNCEIPPTVRLTSWVKFILYGIASRQNTSHCCRPYIMCMGLYCFRYLWHLYGR